MSMVSRAARRFSSAGVDDAAGMVLAGVFNVVCDLMHV